VSIFVGNLPFRAEREDVIQLFVPFGEVLNCSLPLERDTGRKRGFAFIEMGDESIESTAIDGLQGTELMGRPLRINKAEPRGSGGSRRGGRGGYGGGILDLIILTLTNLLEQKVGKIEVMEILLKTLNMKMVGAGEKGEYPMRAMLQTRQIRNPFL